MIFVKVETPEGPFVGQVSEIPSNEYATVRIFNPVLRREHRCAAMHIEKISIEEAEKQFQSDAKIKLKHYREKLAELGISLGLETDHAQARELWIRERTRAWHRAFLKTKGISLDRDEDHAQEFENGHRASHCYKCRIRVDSQFHLECKACRWIICNHCGACGCGHPDFGQRFRNRWTERDRGSKHQANDSIRQSFADFASAREYACEHRGSTIQHHPTKDAWIVVQRHRD